MILLHYFEPHKKGTPQALVEPRIQLNGAGIFHYGADIKGAFQLFIFICLSLFFY